MCLIACVIVCRSQILSEGVSKRSRNNQLEKVRARIIGFVTESAACARIEVRPNTLDCHLLSCALLVDTWLQTGHASRMKSSSK